MKVGLYAAILIGIAIFDGAAALTSAGAITTGMRIGPPSRSSSTGGKLDETNFDLIAVLEDSLKKAEKSLKNAPRYLRRNLPKWRKHAVREFGRYLDNLPSYMTYLTPMMSRWTEHIKHRVNELVREEAREATRRMMQDEGVTLDPVETAVSFCPLANVSAAMNCGMCWTKLSTMLAEECPAIGCGGHLDVCCPVRDNTTGIYGVTVKCLYSHKQHWGSCPDGRTPAKFGRDDLGDLFRHPERFPVCKQDADCAVTEKCCMSDEADGPMATCVRAVAADSDLVDYDEATSNSAGGADSQAE